MAAVLTLLPSVSARAQSCNPSDLWNALDNVGGALASGACVSACADTGGTGCEAAIAIAGILGGVAAGSSQGNVNGFCSQVNNVQNASGNVSAIQSWLTAAGISQSITGEILNALNSIGDPLNVAQCGCSLEQGIDQLGSDVLACLQSAICGLQEDLGWGGCGCTPPPPVAGNCTPAAAACGDYNANQNSAVCQNAIYGQLGINPPPVVTKQTNGGTLVLNVTDGWDGHSAQCSPDTYCFCPSPMQVVAVPNLNADGGNQNNGYVIYVCECPKGTKAAGASGGLAQVCICDSTNLPAVPPVKSVTNPEGSICPTPLTGIPCPNGQVRLGANCVTPCSNPNEGMTLDGACCDPTQMTSCGVCCPPGTTPDPVSGTCLPPQKTQ